MSLLTGARISFLGDSFFNKLNSVWAVLLLPLCDQANHGFGSPSELFSCRSGFVFSCFYKSNFLKMFSFVARTVQPQQPFFLLSFDLEHYN